MRTKALAIATLFLAATSAASTTTGSLPDDDACGDGVLDPGEECDDGNRVTGDGCSALCRIELPYAYADGVVAAPGHTGIGFRDAARAVNGVRGGGRSMGGTDVFSLGFGDDESYIILEWTGRRVLDGPGVDFVAFENPFVIGGGPDVFMEQAVVYLSRDGQTWVPFPHDYVNPDETVYSRDPATWIGFVGVEPVLLHEEDNPVNPFDPALAGGDGFDLALLPDDGGEAEAIKREGFVYMLIITAPTQLNPDTGAPFVRDQFADGTDLDGVYGRYLVSR